MKVQFWKPGQCKTYCKPVNISFGYQSQIEQKRMNCTIVTFRVEIPSDFYTLVFDIDD